MSATTANILKMPRLRVFLAMWVAMAAGSCGPTVALDDEYRLNAANGDVELSTGWEHFSATLGPRAQLHAIFSERVVMGDQLRAELVFDEPLDGWLDLFLMPHCDSHSEPEFSRTHCHLREDPQRCVVEHAFTHTHSCIRVAFYNPTDEPIRFHARKLLVEPAPSAPASR